MNDTSMPRPPGIRPIVLATALWALPPAANASEVSDHAELRAHTADARQDPTPVEHAARLRAMVIFKIAPYLSRHEPAETDETQPYRIAVVGTDATAKAMLKLLPGKRVAGRVIAVTSVDVDAISEHSPDPAFDVLYIAQSLEAAAITRIVERLRKEPTALVCERPAFAANGGGIQLFVKDNGLRFEVNIEALRRQGLRASPHLLKLSKRGPRR